MRYMQPIKHIVINGGGPLLLNMYGALKQSNQLKMWNHVDIESYYGTSAGAILITLMALKYEWDELDNYIINRPWQHILKFNVIEIYDYYANNGIADKSFIYDLFSPLFKAKDIDIHVDFKTFREITGANLYLYATVFSSFDVEEFSADSTPDVSILDAVYASSALPILFRPIQIGERIYVDGSIYMNYPITKCLERNNEPQTILGIRNKMGENANMEKMEDMNMFSYLSQIMNMLFTKSQRCDTKDANVMEIKITSCLNDLSNFFKIANSCIERKIAIEKGVTDATELHSRINEIL